MSLLEPLMAEEAFVLAVQAASRMRAKSIKRAAKIVDVGMRECLTYCRPWRCTHACVSIREDDTCRVITITITINNMQAASLGKFVLRALAARSLPFEANEACSIIYVHFECNEQ